MSTTTNREQTRVAAEIADLVGCESPSEDLAAIANCARLTAEIGAGWLGAPPDALSVQGRTHLLWRFGAATRVLLLGHFDTVWPVGTLSRWPFLVRDGRASGPGVFDMKTGVVQAFAALGRLSDLDGVALLLTSDEEIGSPTSRSLIEDTARDAAAVLVLEPGQGQAVKTGRKGVSLYTLTITGRAAHAGLEPELGVNAAVELAHQVLALQALGDPAAGTTVTPTLASAGSTVNTVPAAASLSIDARALTIEEQLRVDDAVRGLRPRTPGAELAVAGGINRPPLEPARSAELFAIAQRVAADLGQPPLLGASVGGGSDGNFTAALGVATLDGLGAVGGGAHAEGEWTSLAAVPDRISLVSELTKRLLAATPRKGEDR
ncbi:MAG: M20 family metallopeptidase [Mycobacteriales bacterium]